VADGRVRVEAAESLRRRRLAVLLRAALVIPHYIVLSIWSLLVAPAVAIAWLALLIEGRLPSFLHRFLGAFLDHVGLERFSLVVHDWGGGLALATAQRLPERLARLVLFSCTPLLPGYRWHRVARLWRTPVVGETTMGFTTRYTMKRALRLANATPGPMPDEFLDSVYSRFDHGTQRAILRLFRSAPPTTLEHWGRDLGGITAPALILWPTEDPYIPASFGQAYADALGGDTRLEMVEEAGHWSWLDRPELIDTVTRFLGS